MIRRLDSSHQPDSGVTFFLSIQPDPMTSSARIQHDMKMLLFVACLSVIVSTPAAAADREIRTVAGTGSPDFSGDGGPATTAGLHHPFGVEVGPDGHLYVCDMSNHVIRRIDRDTGVITSIAGTGGVSGYTGDGGPAGQAQMNEPYEIRFDARGNLFVVEMMNHIVRRIDAATGIISTVAGTGEKGFGGDNGPAVEAQLNRPHSIVLDTAGDLFICDIGNHRIRRVELKTGMISTWCGTGEADGPHDGAAISNRTPLKGPRTLTVDPRNDLWLALREGNQVVHFDRQAGVIRHVAGTGASGFSGNGGPAAQATLSGPKGIVFDEQRQLVWLADTESHTLRAVDLSTSPPTLRLMAGTGQLGSGPDGDPLKCRMARLHGIGLDPQTGDIYIGDSEAHQVRVLRIRP